MNFKLFSPAIVLLATLLLVNASRAQSNLPPVISIQPASQNIVNGSNAAVWVTATGTPPLAYQWQYDGTNLTDGGSLSGSATNELDLTGVSAINAGDYQVVITNDWGSVTSSVATLTIVFPPAITAQPAGGIVSLGSKAGFAVEATGTAPLFYQWQFNGTNVTDGGPISGSATFNLVVMQINTNNLGVYRVVVTNVWGSVTSLPAPLALGVPAGITNQPVSRTVGFGSNATFSVSATGTQPLSYHWQLNGTNLATSPSVNDATAFAMTLERVTNSAYAGSYDVVVSNTWGSVTSSVVTLTIAYPPTLTSQPGSQVVTYSTNVMFGVGVTGTGPFSYQWLLNGKYLTNNLITTVAGNGTTAYAGDGGPATNASLWYPSDVAVDAAGNLFIADTEHQRIRKVNGNGVITTVVGNGNAGYNGNALAATNSSLAYPAALAVDGNDNLFIADTDNSRIRMETYGLLITVAGNSSSSFSGDGGDAFNAGMNSPEGVAVDADGNVYIADTANSRIRRVDINDIITTVAGKGSYGYSGDGGLATNAALNSPSGVAVDAVGNLYISDTGNNRVRKLGTNGLITTVAGNGLAGFSGDGGAATNAYLSRPASVALDAYGNLWIADTDNQRIRKVNAAGIISTVAGHGVLGYAGDGGAATNASLYYPAGVALDAAGDLFIADSSSQRIRKVTPQGPAFTVANASPANAGNYQVIVSSTWGSVTSSVAVLSVDFPPSISLQPTNQSILNNHVATLSVKASGSAPLAYQWQFNGTNLTASAAAADHLTSPTTTNLYVNPATTANAGNYDLVITNAFGSVTSSVAVLTLVFPPAITNQPVSQNVINGQGATLSVVAGGTAPLSYQWQFNGTNLKDGGGLTNSGGGLTGSATPSLTLNTVTAANGGNYEVIITNAWGLVTSSVATLTIVYPPAITNPPVSLNLLTGQNGAFNVGVTGTGPFTYQWLLNGTNLPNSPNLPNGIITTVAGTGLAGYAGDGGAATNARLNLPFVLTFDPAGNLYVADNKNNVIRKMDANGIITTVAGNGTQGDSGSGGAATNASLFAPSGLVADEVGNLFIADGPNNVVLRVDPNGILTVVAGNGTQGYAGDGGAATNALLAYPSGLAVDAGGNLFIADYFNSVVRRMDANGLITTVAGNGSAGYAGDGGAATNAQLFYPYGLAVDPAGHLFIADLINNDIRRVDPNGIITTVAGNGAQGYAGDGGAATNAAIDAPEGVAVDALGHLFIADSHNNVIRQVDPNGIITTVAGDGANGYSGDGGAATNATLNNAADMAVAAGGTLYIADTYNNVLRAVNPYGGSPSLAVNHATTNLVGNYQVVVSSAWGSVTSSVVALQIGSPPGITNEPVSQTIVSGSNAAFSVTATGTEPLSYQWQFGGANLTDGGGVAGSATASVAVNPATGASGGAYDVVITNAWGSVTSRVAVLNIVYPPTITNPPVSQIIVAGNATTFSVGAAGTGPFVYQWLLNGTNLPDGIISTAAGTNGLFPNGGVALAASLSYPFGVVADGAGNLYIADTDNQRIRKVTAGGLISTVAGNGTNGFSGDGGAATNANLSYPAAVAVDAGGNLFIVDRNNNRIRRVDANGIITTVAGNGLYQYSGDGGLATNASLARPVALAVDAGGNLFIADESNECIRRVSAGGLISTVAGNGNAGYAGDGGAATNASLWTPAGVAMDAQGDLFIADLGNGRIREVSNGGLISTVAGGGYAGLGDGGAATNANLEYPVGVTVDAGGDLLIADEGTDRIRRVDANGLITTVAGNGTFSFSGDGGAATNAGLSHPSSVTVDLYGNLEIADTDNNRIRQVTQLGAVLPVASVNPANAGNYQVIINNAWGSVTSSVAGLTVVYPPSILQQPTNQAIALGGKTILSVAVGGTAPWSYQWQFNGANVTDGGGYSGSATARLALNPVTPVTAGNYDVIITNAWGSITSSVVGLTIDYPPTLMNPPANLSVVSGRNGTFSVGVAGTGPFSYQWLFDGTNLPNGLISTVAGNGGATYSGDGGRATNANLYYPSGVAVDTAGNIYIADTDNQRIRMVNPNGIITTVAGTNYYGYGGDGGPAAGARLAYPAGVAVDAAGNLFIADMNNHRVRKVNANGLITTVAGNGGAGYAGDGAAATNAELYFPAGVAVDAAGNLFIADLDNQRVRKVNTNGIITTVAGKGVIGSAGDGGAATLAALDNPAGVAVDAAGNLFIADKSNQRVREVNTSGIITTVAGTGVSGSAGDGGAATLAALNNPAGVAVDAAGHLFIADSGGQHVRKVNTNGVITTVAGSSGGGFLGDGGAAVNALLNDPAGVAVDPYGNLFIADEHNDRIRKVILQGPVLPLAGVTAANAGNYQVVITNAWGSVTSSVAALTILFPPTLSQPPVSLSVVNGSNATFSAVAAGTAPLVYQWQFEGVNLSDGGNLSGSATPSLRLSQATAANVGGYDLIVNNPWGGVTSSVVTLTLTYPPTLLTQPVSQMVTNGTPVAFNVGVIGSGPFTYQWLYNGKALPLNHISTVAGNGTNGYAGDGGLATKAELNDPSGVAVAEDGNLFIVDAGNRLIRLVNPSGLITTVAGGGQNSPGSGLSQATSEYLSLSGSYSTYSGVAVDADDNLFIADTEYQRILLMTYDLLLTVAGGGGSFPGDGTNAISAELNQPSGVAVDAEGNLFFSDTFHSRVRKVNPAGILTTVAGTNYSGFSGDGGAATNAETFYPAGVAVDAFGNLFFADYGNNRVRKVNANGLITTLAGGGAHFPGDGLAATNAILQEPVGVAVDASGNVYIADTEDRRIRMVTPGGIISTVAGNGNYIEASTGDGDGGAATNASFNQPSGVAVDASGDLFIVDTANNRIRKVTPQGPTLTLAYGNPTNAGTYQVIVSSASGSVTSSVVNLTVLVAPSILRQPVSQSIANGGSGAFSATAAGTPPLGYQWQFNGTNLLSGILPQDATTTTLPLSLVTAANAGVYDLLISNAYGSVTSRVATLTITYPPVFLSEPQSLTVNPGQAVNWNVAVTGGLPLSYQWYFDGMPVAGQTGTNLLLAGVTPAVAGDYFLLASNQYASMSSSQAALTVLGPPVITAQPAGGALIAGGGTLLSAGVAGVGPCHYQWQLNGTNLPGVPDLIVTVAGRGAWGYFGDGGAAAYAGLGGPAGLAVDTAGNLFIADEYNDYVRKVDARGIITTVAGNGLFNYSGDGGSATNASLRYPLGVAVDADDNLFIADEYNNCIRKVDPSGIITTVAGNGVAGYSGDGGPATNASLAAPSGVAVDDDGNLYVADTGNSSLRRVDVNGLITTLAGNGVAGYSGDGGPVTNSILDDPCGLTTDAAGDLFIVDSGNQRLREAAVTGLIATVAGDGLTGYSGDGGAATNASLDNQGGPYELDGVAVDVSGNLYFADEGNQRIREVGANGIITTLAGNGTDGYSGDGGPATNATVSFPAGLAVDAAGDLFIADSDNDVVREIIPSGGSPTLTLPNLTPNNAGQYQLIITNAFGSVTSSIVTLTVSLPQICATPNPNGGVTLSLLTAPNTSSEVLVATNLNPPVVWQALGSDIPGTNGLWQFVDTNTSLAPVRFYRSSTP